jgi:hypothetical protein
VQASSGRTRIYTGRTGRSSVLLALICLAGTGFPTRILHDSGSIKSAYDPRIELLKLAHLVGTSPPPSRKSTTRSLRVYNHHEADTS